jgi:hypothetical protein
MRLSCCHTAERTSPEATNQVVFCRIIVHVLHQLIGSAVRIVQCDTTTNLMHAFGGKHLPCIVVASFLVRVGPGRPLLPRAHPIEEASISELFTYSRRLEEVQ